MGLGTRLRFFEAETGSSRADWDFRPVNGHLKGSVITYKWYKLYDISTLYWYYTGTALVLRQALHWNYTESVSLILVGILVLISGLI